MKFKLLTTSEGLVFLGNCTTKPCWYERSAECSLLLSGANHGCSQKQIDGLFWGVIIKFSKNEIVGINKEYVLQMVKPAQLSGGDAKWYSGSPWFASQWIINNACNVCFLQILKRLRSGKQIKIPLGVEPCFPRCQYLSLPSITLLHSVYMMVQITVNISENSSESSPTDKAKLKVDFCIETSIGIVKLATGGLYREL